MKISDLILMSVNNLRRRKGRTALTIIGVVVGTCAIVVMISLGIAMSRNNEAMLASWGDLTKIEIYNYGNTNNRNDPRPKLDDAMVKTMQGWDHVVSATPYYQASSLDGQVVSGRNDRYQSTSLYNIYGLYVDALEPMGFTLKSGSFLTEKMKVGKGKIPVLVGENYGYTFEDTRRSENSSKRQIWSGQTDANGNPVPAFVDFDRDTFTLQLVYKDDDKAEKKVEYELVIVGVLTSDYNAGYFTDSGIVMRLSDLQSLETEYKKLSGDHSKKSSTGYEQVYVKVDKVDNVEPVETKIKDLGYDTYSMTQIREEMQKSVLQSQMILGGLAAISLLVAALNIANTMTMAIYERTREIGVMKVLGCELGNIRAMFLVESGTIGFLGGVVGVFFSLAISFIMNHLAEIGMMLGTNIDLSSVMSSMSGGWGSGGSSTISIVPLWLILLALGFATMVGLLSGIAPAGRAMKISALEAIRRE